MMIGALLAHGMSAAILPGGENWPGFHNGGDTSLASQGLPLEWTPDEGIAWELPLTGYGQSAPIVWDNRIYLTAVEGDQKETCLVMSVDALSGEPLWTRTFSSSVTVRNSYMVSRAAPTPLADADGLYVLFESGDLHALAHDGAPRWQRALFDDDERAFQNGHGYGASPAQTEDAVIVLVDHRGPSFLAAFSKQTGEPLWKTERSPRSSWTSPHVVQFGIQTQIVVSSSGSVDGYDADSGRLLWSHEGVSGNLIPSATVQGDRVYVGAAGGRADSSAASVAASNCCLHITSGDTPGYALLWRAESAVCDYASPLVHRGYAYYVNKMGVVRCLDAETGRECYVHRTGNPCWAQPIAAGDAIYFFGKRGETTVIRSGPEFEELAANRLWFEDAPPVPQRSFEYEPEDENDPRPRHPDREYLDPIVYGVAAVNGAFYVRLGTHLFCITARSSPARGETLPGDDSAR